MHAHAKGITKQKAPYLPEGRFLLCAIVSQLLLLQEIEHDKKYDRKTKYETKQLSILRGHGEQCSMFTTFKNTTRIVGRTRL
ncbi:MAG: hypothetical protein RIQ41_493 [Candidatus Parcubacteria bacterium]|jgi:hypothetical protein